MQNGLARELVLTLPLDLLAAQTEGSLGHLLRQELLNELRRNDVRQCVITLITRVLVDRDDPAFAKQSKPVGPFYRKKDVAGLLNRFPEWRIVEDAGRGYRRIVPSPMPRRILQSQMIRSLAYARNVFLAPGGGGVPMTEDSAGQYLGVEAVIDKDLSSTLLALYIKADVFVILTGTESVCLNYGRPDARPLDEVTCAKAEQYMKEGHFPPGSMRPKMAAALLYLKAGGRNLIITDPETLNRALDGKTGARVVWK